MTTSGGIMLTICTEPGEMNKCQSDSLKVFNPLSPNIHIQILQTDLYTFSLRMC